MLSKLDNLIPGGSRLTALDQSERNHRVASCSTRTGFIQCAE